MEGLKYTDNGLYIEFFPTFLSSLEAEELYNLVVESMIKYKKITPGKRVNFTFGDAGVSYTVSFGSQTITRVARPWSEYPILKVYRDRLVALTGSKTGYNYVVVQYYPSGKAQISPHRDKEMAPGTDIAGVSVGETRDLVMSPPGYIRGSTPLTISLTDGSLYILKPPTNDHWSHSIPRADTEKGRVSLTYRYVSMS